MDGVSAVQARISDISSRFASLAAVNAGWSSAAAAAGLTGSSTATTASSTSASSTSSSSGNAVVDDAEQYLGVPYLWGGTDPSTGLDCSGLTQRVYADLGITIPRTSSQQATAGTAVASLDQAEPGDLVFYDYDSSRAGVDHVGIYIGNGKMIAAPTEGENVQVQDVGNPTLIRRILPDSSTSTTTASAASASSSSALAGVPYANLFTAAASKYGVSASLLAGVAKTESGFDTTAVSSVGAQGLMQFMPATAKSLGVDTSDAASSIDGAAKYLKSLMNQFGSTSLALAAYNAGPTTVRNAGGIPASAASYVQKVLTAAEGYS